MAITHFRVIGEGENCERLKQRLVERGVTVNGEGMADALLYAPDFSGFDNDTRLSELDSPGEVLSAYEAIPVRLLNIIQDNLDKVSKNARICILTHTDGAIGVSGAEGGYPRKIALAALHMLVMLLFNRLRPKGYTFRLFGGENMAFAAEYFLRDRSFEKGNPRHSDEDRLVLRGDHGVEVPW